MKGSFKLTADMDTETYRRLTEQLTERGPWQQTAHGRAFFLADPRPEEVHVDDIAQALSRICRYNGHLKPGYAPLSVAQHACNVARWMAEDGFSDRMVFAGLHHDSGEGYTGDIVSQIKFVIPEVKKFTKRVDAVVNEALGISLTAEEEAQIKDYDLIALATEMDQLLGKHTGQFSWGAIPAPRNEQIFPWPHHRAYKEFMRMHKKYGGVQV